MTVRTIRFLSLASVGGHPAEELGGHTAPQGFRFELLPIWPIAGDNEGKWPTDSN